MKQALYEVVIGRAGSETDNTDNWDSEMIIATDVEEALAKIELTAGEFFSEVILVGRATI